VSRKGVEPLTCGLGNRCSILLSYRDVPSAAPRRNLLYHAAMTRSSGSTVRAAGLSRLRHAGALALFASLSACMVQGALAQSACPVTGLEHVAAVSVDERLEIALTDGRLLRVAGIEPVRPTPDDPDFATAARDALQKALAKGLDIIPLAGPDRWGRIPVFAFLAAPAPNASAPSLAAWLLAQGYGRFMPEPAATACRANFLAIEASARAAQRGLWRDPYYAVIAATDRRAFVEKTATNVIVEGQIIDVDVRPKRLYVLFGPRHSGGFAVTIVQREVKIFDRAGFDFHALIGRRIRVRGLLDMRFGPQIEVSEPGAIEIVSQPETLPGVGQHVEAKAADLSEKPQ
jgi:endonuclease YncB( thermonuclease family)